MRAKNRKLMNRFCKRESQPLTLPLWSPLTLLVLGLLIQGLAHATLSSPNIIGKNANRVKEKDYPAFCSIEIQSRGSDESNSCSGTLVAAHEIATGAHCFKKYFNLNQADVRVYCGGRSVQVTSVALPSANM